MNNNKTIFTIGATALIISFLGLPIAWEIILIRLLCFGALLIGLSGLISDKKKRNSVPQRESSFVENGSSIKNGERLSEMSEVASEHDSQKEE